MELLNNEVKFLINKFRQNNLILYRITDTEEVNNNLNDHVKKLLKDVISQDGIEKVSRIGYKVGNRPVVVTLSDQKYKEEILKYDSLKENHKIVIACDSTIEERENYKKLKKIRDQLTCKYQNISIKKNKIIIDDQS